jgi:Trk K+ transport system NAD-binding subunit
MLGIYLLRLADCNNGDQINALVASAYDNLNASEYNTLTSAAIQKIDSFLAELTKTMLALYLLRLAACTNGVQVIALVARAYDILNASEFYTLVSAAIQKTASFLAELTV